MFSAYNGGNYMIGTIYSEMGLSSLGFINLMVVYGSCAFFNAFAESLTLYFTSCVTGIIIGGSGYFLSLGVNFFTAFCSVYSGKEDEPEICKMTSFLYLINIMASFSIGIFDSLIWGSQYQYITLISRPENRGKFSGFFYSIIQSSPVLGTVIPIVVFFFTENYMIFYGILTSLALIGLFSFSILPRVYPEVKNESTVEPLKKIAHEFREMKLLLRRPMLLLLLPYFMISGFVMSFGYSFLDEIIQRCLPEDLTKNQVIVKTAYVILLMGVVSTLSGNIIGRLTDLGSRSFWMKVDFVVFLFMIALSGLLEVFHNYYTMFLLGGLAGYLLATSWANSLAIVSNNYPSNMGGYTIMRVVQNFMIAVGILLDIALEKSPSWVWLLIIFLVSGVWFPLVILHREELVNGSLEPEENSKSSVSPTFQDTPTEKTETENES